MRKSFKKSIAFIVVIFISASLFFGYNYVINKLERSFSRFAEENLGVTLSIGYILVRFPLCLELRDIKIDDTIEVPKVRVYPNPAPFLLKDIFTVSQVKIIDPVVRIKKGARVAFSPPRFLNKEAKGALSGFPAANFYFSKISIQNGTLIYEGSKGPDIELVRIKGGIERPRLHFGKEGIFHFTAVGFLKNKSSEFLSPLRLSGYMGYNNVIRAEFKANDIKIEALGPIYSLYLSEFMEDGRIDFGSDIQVSGTHLLARCSLEGEDIALRKGAEQKVDAPFMANFILLFNFKSGIVKVKNLQGNFFNLILGRT